MQSFWATPATPTYRTRIHPALTSFADECCGTLARLFAYLGTLALLVILAIHLWDQLPTIEADPAPAAPEWGVAGRTPPAFAVSPFDLLDKTATYVVLRHPQGGRKDIMRWSAGDPKPGEKPVAELEIYRPGGELGRSGPPIAQITARMDPEGGRPLETAGVVDSKFGTVTLLRPAGAIDETRSCLGFLKRIDEPRLQISGWSCQGDALPARRAAIACILNRLILLAAGNDPKLAALFAHAELNRGSCAAPASAATSADWMTTMENTHLRGAL